MLKDFFIYLSFSSFISSEIVRVKFEIVGRVRK